MLSTIRDLFQVETDGTDWPKIDGGPLPDECKRALQEHVLLSLRGIVDKDGVCADCEKMPTGADGRAEFCALHRYNPVVWIAPVTLATHELYSRVRDRAKGDPRCEPFNKAAYFPWLYACITRAARGANCEERWHAPPLPTPPHPEEPKAPSRRRRVKGR